MPDGQATTAPMRRAQPSVEALTGARRAVSLRAASGRANSNARANPTGWALSSGWRAANWHLSGWQLIVALAAIALASSIGAEPESEHADVRRSIRSIARTLTLGATTSTAPAHARRRRLVRDVQAPRAGAASARLRLLAPSSAADHRPIRVDRALPPARAPPAPGIASAA